jgi:hypothetical protein
MESSSSTNHKLMTILNELKQLEPIFHHPELGTNRSDFENMMADEFWEVGASGRIYNRQYVLDELEKRYSNPVKDVWETKDFNCMEIAPDNYLLTYTLLQGSRITRRSTIWRRTDERWMIVYHQGTPVKEI